MEIDNAGVAGALEKMALASVGIHGPVAWAKYDYYCGDPVDVETADPIRAFAILWGYRLRGRAHDRYESKTHDIDGLTGLQAVTDIWCRLGSQSMLHESDVDNICSRLQPRNAALIPVGVRQQYVRGFIEPVYNEIKQVYPHSFCHTTDHDAPVLKYFKRFVEGLCHVTTNCNGFYGDNAGWEINVWNHITKPTLDMLEDYNTTPDKFGGVITLLSAN
jgi:hypothetical protein